MLRKHKAKGAKKRRIRFAGIVQAAARLEVTRVHLYLVLSGQRKSPELLKRYRKLKAAA